MLQIHIRNIKDIGVEINEKVEPELIGVREEDSLKFNESLKAKLKVNKTENMVLIDIDVNGQYSSICSRCLDDVRQRWSGSFLLDYEVQKKTEFIDISEDLRQEIILSLPARVLCQAECKGLCVDCGVNLNIEGCKNKIQGSGVGVQGSVFLSPAP